MSVIYYIDRISKKKNIEQVYGEEFIELMYGSGPMSILARLLLKPVVCDYPIFSHLYGAIQKSSLSKCKIAPFIKKFHMDESEFLDGIDSYKCFNDFFVRRLKPTARPIASGDNTAALPADARYMFYSDISTCDGFLVKGSKFSLLELLKDENLAKKYENGSMLIARLCPTDYHRFHFPFDCVPSETKLINGVLSSVNPLALKKNIHIFTENKRTITTLESKKFGTVLFLEIGATCVGGIHQTYKPGEFCQKGQEKGYFSFGGSSLVLLFEKGKIAFDQDLLAASKEDIEIKCLMGQSLGTC